MKKIKNILKTLGISFGFLFLMSLSVQAQLVVNEIEVDPPNDVGDRCQYVELRGAPGSTVPANTYFISINSDQSNFGFLNAAVNIGGQVVGSNGTITLINTVGGACPNRTYASGTTIVNYNVGLTLGQGSEGFYIVTSATALFAGQDLDTNNDGVLDVAITFIDGFNFIFNPDEQYKYGPGPVLNTTFGGDVPDAVTRFPGNSAVNSAAAYYFGELASTPEETTTYAAPFSANFPTGGMLTPGAANVPAATPGSTKARADFDGDGRTDISVFRPSDGNWYLNRSTAGFVAVKFGATGDVIVPGDYDGDNRTDVAVRRGSQWYILNSSNSAVVQYITWGFAADIPVPGDYDGDNKTDVAVFRPSDGTWYILKTSGGTQFSAFGQNGDVPVPADYDGDGRTDLAVYRSGTWYIQQSTAGFRAVVFGATGDQLVPADYDGDNKDDIAVFRPSNGTWYRLNSSNGQFAAFLFGANGDIPVPGDYDGDGRDDIAVVRSGTWYLSRSSSGFAGTVFGFGSDEPVPNAYLP